MGHPAPREFLPQMSLRKEGRREETMQGLQERRERILAQTQNPERGWARIKGRRENLIETERMKLDVSVQWRNRNGISQTGGSRSHAIPGR